MPTVPRYVQTERPQGYQNVQPVAGGAEAMGRAWRGLGDAVGGVGKDLYGIAINERDRFDKAVVQEKQTAYEDIMLTAQQRESERKGKNALGDDQGSQGVFDSISRIHKETAQSCLQGVNERQKLMLEDYFNKRGRAFSAWGHEYEQRERGVYEKGQAEAYQQSQLMRALNDPSQLQAAMGNMAASILEFNRSRGIDDEATKLQIQEGWDKAGLAIVKQALEADDVGAASAFLAQHGRDLSPALVRDLGTRIQSAQEKVYWEAAGQLRDVGDVEALERLKKQGMPSPSAQGLNGGIAAQTAQFQGRTVYGFGSRDPEKGSVDCSGWVGYALEKCGVNGYRGLTADKMVDKARRQGGAVSAEELLRNPRGGIVIGLDQGKKGWDAGRVDGIDHVVVTYEDPATGSVMVSESSGRQGAAGSGVHGTPLEKWLAYHQRKGHKIFAGDISGQAQGAGSMPAGSKSRMDAKMDAYIEKAKEVRDKKLAEAAVDNVMGQIKGLPPEDQLPRAVQLVENLPEKQRNDVIRQVEANVKWLDTVRKAGVQDEVNQLIENVVKPNTGKSYNVIIDAVEDTRFSREAKDKIIGELEKRRDGKENKAASAAALAQYRSWYDRRAGMGSVDPNEKKSMILSLNMNMDDIQKAEEYGGKRSMYSYSDVAQMVLRMDKNANPTKIGKLYEALMQDPRILEGKNLTDEEVKNALWLLNQKGKVVSGDSSSTSLWYEAVTKGEGDRFRFEVPKNMMETVERATIAEAPYYRYVGEDIKKAMREVTYFKMLTGRELDLPERVKDIIKAAREKSRNSIGGK